MEKSLQHYGVKGMKWGVRRTPEQLGHRSASSRPYKRTSKHLVEKGVSTKQQLAKDVLGRDLGYSEIRRRKQDSGPTDIKKGSKVQHISGVPFNKLNKGQLYVTAMEGDNHLYESFLGMRLLNKGFDPKKIVLELKEDISAPSSKQQYKMFKDFASKNREQIEKDVTAWAKSKNKDIPSMSKNEDLYEHFMNSIEKASSSQKAFYAYLKKSGYNAVLDEHDITGSWMQGEKPLIIMNPLSSIGSIKVEDLTPQSMEKALDAWLKL